MGRKFPRILYPPDSPDKVVHSSAFIGIILINTFGRAHWHLRFKP